MRYFNDSTVRVNAKDYRSFKPLKKLDVINFKLTADRIRARIFVIYIEINLFLRNSIRSKINLFISVDRLFETILVKTSDILI